MPKKNLKHYYDPEKGVNDVTVVLIFLGLFSAALCTLTLIPIRLIVHLENAGETETELNDYPRKNIEKIFT